MHYGHILAGRPGHARIAIRVPAKRAHNAFWVLPLVIFATKDTLTFTHGDVQATFVTLPAGKKLWFLARRRADLGPDDRRGDMRSRLAFKSYDPWGDNTDVFVFEIVYLDQYTTLLMPTPFLHLVITIEDSIGLGRHVVPAANITACVYTALHNTITGSATTNADHESARQFLVRIFIFWTLKLVDRGAPTRRERAHLPDLLRKEGVIDLLALRSFVVLFVALSRSLYKDSAVDQGLPLSDDMTKELSFAWKQAHAIVKHVEASYNFEVSSPVNQEEDADSADIPDNFSAAASSLLVNMAASMYFYLVDEYDEKRKEKDGFTPSAFSLRLGQSLAMFDRHTELGEGELFVDLSDDTAKESTLMQKFETMIAVEDEDEPDDQSGPAPMLVLWDEASLPFVLKSKAE
ncbi:hypothetical protein FB45DRAFT_1032127 [Roridomyces roridus]|uniref:Uncharacterized protein n=1 Tax=Roridomyces roridus TaxID=1738132 RepID=A0AAD7BIZ6_9AGAR|nr:hypothetical protein FB45DRAFT_1032127 [Roridomyces roridus]